MWKNVVVVDVHAHMSTPPEFGAVVNTMVALNTPNQRFSLTDESLEGALQRHLRVMDERSIDFQLVGPRPVGMYHWMRPFLQAAWSRITNNVIAQTVKLHPNRFAGMAQLPQNPFDNDTKTVRRRTDPLCRGAWFCRRLLKPRPRRSEDRTWLERRILVSALRDGPETGCSPAGTPEHIRRPADRGRA